MCFQYCYKNKEKKCDRILYDLSVCGVIRDPKDKIFLLQNIDIWINNYKSNDIILNYVYALLNAEIQNKNKNIDKKDIQRINNALRSILYENNDYEMI